MPGRDVYLDGLLASPLQSDHTRAVRTLGIPLLVRGALVAAERPKLRRCSAQRCAKRFGSAARLNADSHPIGGRDSVVTTGDEAFEACLGTSGRRSPLWV